MKKLLPVQIDHGLLQFSRATFSKTVAAVFFSALLIAMPAAVEGTTFTGGMISFNDGGNAPTQASPYPGSIVVSGLGSQISSITLTLTNFTRSGRPDDLDMLLVGPTGASLIVFSDVGGTGAATGPFTFVLSDSGATFLPDAGPFVSGTFKPTNESTAQDTFSAPAPSGPYGNPGGATVGAGSATFSSVFGGTNPNGTWSLYIVDDTPNSGGETGSISAWSLDITATAVPEPNTWALLIIGTVALLFFSRRRTPVVKER
jgi:PEP-CTERM motif